LSPTGSIFHRSVPAFREIGCAVARSIVYYANDLVI
jgi:hypothetical protein